MTEESPRTTELPDPLVGSTVAGRYRIERLLGSGGMGAVYQAEHVHMRKTVALKVLHKEFIGVNEVVARFEREAIAAGRIEHPNVVPATDFGKLDDGSFYLVLEYIEGTSLRALLDQGPLAWERAVDIARQVVSALVAAHAAGIVHRDLKPDNVMLVPQPDGSERVKVLDFGIARVSVPDAERDATHLTKVGAVMGTVQYMSPEQALGEEVDERTDLYALGVIVHEMISGRAPFDAATAAQILAKQITEAPPPLPSGTPAALGTLVGELLRKTAIERPPSARAVLERLEGVASASAAAAAPTAVHGRRSRRFLVVAVGVAAATIGIAAAMALSGGEERSVAPEVVPSPTRPNSRTTADRAASARGAELGVAPSEPARSGEEGEGVSAEPNASVSVPAQAPSTSPAVGKSTSKRRTQSTDSGKKRKGPGGIYIPPPSEWF